MNKKRSSKRSELAQLSIASIMRMRERYYRGFSELLKPYDLTEPKFNVLRILRGSGADGLPTLEIGSRMITHIPDITRLLDRLETDGLVTRERCPVDRRIVRARLTAKSSKMLSKLDGPINDFLLDSTAFLSDKELSGFVALTKKFSTNGE